ncbi:MAG: hypothetical protein DMG61_13605 [Acidobacteria bacterium]|nr:MAG: hypothetical protein DMG61_13605 [Acidobacteriota bacterium]
MRPGIWEKVFDALFWLQLVWIFSGFLLMAYFALKVFPADKEATNSRSDSGASAAQRPELITLGNYRFEVASDTSMPRTKVIELYPKRSDRDAGLR